MVSIRKIRPCEAVFAGLVGKGARGGASRVTTAEDAAGGAFEDFFRGGNPLV